MPGKDLWPRMRTSDDHLPYRLLTARLRDSRIEACIAANDALISHDAAVVDIDPRAFEHQVRLHLPSVNPDLLNDGHYESAYAAVRSVSLVRAAGIRQEQEEAELGANSSLLLPKQYAVRRDLTLEAEDGSRLPLSFRLVPSNIGYNYQSRLHYLKSARGDTLLQFGMFLPGASHPLTYVALSVCDRPYMADNLIASQLAQTRQDCLVLTRMYGLPGVPQNLMSLTIKQVVAALRRLGAARLLLTAYNPLLGFDGAMFRASGFRPFAIAPVSYRYTAFGEFTTRRNGRGVTCPGNNVPPNVLMVRGIDKALQRKIINKMQLVQISNDEYQANIASNGHLPQVDAAVWLKQLRSYRVLLEDAWSNRTVHPSYLDDSYTPIGPKGQCGVSSVWLARVLRQDFGVEADYCYGDLRFSDGVSRPVNHHCWVEVGKIGDPDRMIIDLTCDQAESIDDPVLCGTYRHLEHQGLSYVAHTRLTVDELPRDRVWYRFMQLDDAISSRSSDLARVS